MQEHELNDYLTRTGGGSHACEVAPLLDALLSQPKDCGNGGCDSTATGNPKPTPWRPVWTEIPSLPSQPPPPSLDQAQPQPSFQPPRCIPTTLGCCTAESLQPQAALVFGHDYPQVDPTAGLRDFARAGYQMPGGNSNAMSYPAVTSQTTSLVTNDIVPHLAYDTANLNATSMAPNLGCAPGNDCRAQNGSLFGLPDQYTNHSVRL